MNLHQAPACHLKEALQLYLNDNTQTSQLRKENLWGKKLGCWCMHSQSSQLLINRCFCPIGVPITINHCHVQAICLRITINLRITLSGHQESRNSAKNCDLNPLLFFCHLPGMRLSSTTPNHTAEWQTAASAGSRAGLPHVLQGSEIVDCLFLFYSYTKWLRSM